MVRPRAVSLPSIGTFNGADLGFAGHLGTEEGLGAPTGILGAPPLPSLHPYSAQPQLFAAHSHPSMAFYPAQPHPATALTSHATSMLDSLCHAQHALSLELRRDMLSMQMEVQYLRSELAGLKQQQQQQQQQQQEGATQQHLLLQARGLPPYAQVMAMPNAWAPQGPALPSSLQPVAHAVEESKNNLWADTHNAAAGPSGQDPAVGELHVNGLGLWNVTSDDVRIDSRASIGSDCNGQRVSLQKAADLKVAKQAQARNLPPLNVVRPKRKP